MNLINEMITIQERFAGPPGMGNGGYVCGLLARNLPGTVEVTLRQPTPLERPLTLHYSYNHSHLLDGDSLIAEAQTATLALEVPEPPDYQAASATRHRYLDQAAQHPFPHCFVCGPQREYGDGLQIYPGPLAGQNLVATTWEPHPSLADEEGFIRSEFLWAALDCPGGIMAAGDQPRPLLLGRLTAQLSTRIRPHDRCIVIGWPIATNGRKQIVGTSIFSEGGQLIGKAQAIWFEVA